MLQFDSHTALIVVDIQNDFAHPNGSLRVPHADRVIAQANAAITDASVHGALVAYTQDWHPEHTPHFERDGGIWPVHCVGDSWGAAWHSDLTVGAGPVVRKGVDGDDGYSGFTTRDPQSGHTTATALEQILREAGVTRCIVVGLASDYCVKETALDAHRLGFDVVVPTEHVAAVDVQPGDGQRALDDLAARGILIH